jgi:hypothetical protein
MKEVHFVVQRCLFYGHKGDWKPISLDLADIPSTSRGSSFPGNQTVTHSEGFLIMSLALSHDESGELGANKAR